MSRLSILISILFGRELRLRKIENIFKSHSLVSDREYGYVWQTLINYSKAVPILTVTVNFLTVFPSCQKDPPRLLSFSENRKSFLCDFLKKGCYEDMSFLGSAV